MKEGLKRIILQSTRLKRLARSLLASFLRMKFHHLSSSRKSGVREGGEGEDELIVSLTSYPPRLKTLYLTIESLFQQTHPPHRIILWLAKEEVTDLSLPTSLKRLESRGLSIRFTKENLRSYDKLIHALGLYPQATIVTVDDDVLYRKDLLESFLKVHKKYPNDIICDRGLVMIRESDASFSSYGEWECCLKERAGNDIFAVGLSGILYPSGSLSNEIFNKALFQEISPSADDIWFKAMSLLNGREVRSLGNPFQVTIGGTQEEGLFHENRTKNDEQLKAVFDHYYLYEKLPITKGK